MQLVSPEKVGEHEIECEACLLIVDDHEVSPSALGEQVRNLIDEKPLTRNIYVVAPSLSGETFRSMLLNGLAVLRANVTDEEGSPKFWMLDLQLVDSQLSLQALPYAVAANSQVVAGSWQPVDRLLIEGWLFDLFRSSDALVQAPHGVHFAKSSGRHSNSFLRASSVLMSTAACGFISMVTLASIRNLVPRRMFVDTAPLLSLAFSMYQVASTRGLWDLMPPAKSFSSYGEIERLPGLGIGDLVLVSASTSGGLAGRLRKKGVHHDMLATLFYLGTNNYPSDHGAVVCDLTVRKKKLFGFESFETYSTEDCKHCRDGDVLAELEGDQFLIDRRQVKLLRLGGDTQLQQARSLLTSLSRRRLISVAIYESSVGRTRVRLSTTALLDPASLLYGDFSRLVSRFMPQPLHIVVLVGMSQDSAKGWMKSIGLEKMVGDSTFLDYSEIEQIKIVDLPQNVLVLLSVLDDHATARSVNASLRPKCNGGNVSYISGISIASSARAAEDLRIFLSFGSRGPDSFTFKSAQSLLLPYVGTDPSPWAIERAYLQELPEEFQKITEIATRLDFLSNAGNECDSLFLPGCDGLVLKIRPDFVFLDTIEDPDAVSHADVFAVVSNVLACARAGKNNVTKAPARGTPTWQQTSLYQVLLCPSNFRDFNDPILRACLLRAGESQEMNYVLDETSSAEMLAVVQTDLIAWSNGGGHSLPEFLLALSTGRLRLTHQHAASLKSLILDAPLSGYPLALASKFLNS